MDYLQQIITSLPEKPAVDYDALMLSVKDYGKLIAQFQENSASQTMSIPETFGGIAIKEHFGVPEGFATMTKGKAVVGIMDIKKGLVTLFKPSTEPHPSTP